MGLSEVLADLVPEVNSEIFEKCIDFNSKKIYQQNFTTLSIPQFYKIGSTHRTLTLSTYSVRFPHLLEFDKRIIKAWMATVLC